MKVCRKNHQSRFVFLLSDLFIYASAGISEKQFIFHKKIDLELCSVEDMPDMYGIKHAFKLVSSVKSFTLYAGKLIYI